MSSLIRSMSLHREQSSSRRGSSGGDSKAKSGTQKISTPIIGRRNWSMGKWLSSETSSSSHSRQGYNVDVSPPLKERQILNINKQTPAMALVLRKLKELLPQFCHAMAEGHFIKCCSLLGSVSSTSQKQTPAPYYSSPIFGRGSSSPVSPSRSPIRAWLTGSAMERSESNEDSQNVLNETAVLENNLDVFFLLTGVESMYTSLEHANSTGFAALMVTCYEQAVKDLQFLRLNMTDAFLMNAGDSVNDAASKTASGLTVASLTSTLSFLVAFCQARIQCIQLQSALWHSSPDFADMAGLFKTLLPDLQRLNQSSIFDSLHTSIVNELGAWASICETAFSVQHCRFAESILAAQASKTNILQMRSKRTSKDLSCLDWWLQDTLKSIIGTFPIVFDKVSAFATPLYGFNEDIDATPSASSTNTTSVEELPSFRNMATLEGFEAELNEALLKYEKQGAISVAVVIDALQTSHARVEAGLALTETGRGSGDSPLDPEAAIHQRFPAVFIRSKSSLEVQPHPLDPVPPSSSSNPPSSNPPGSSVGTKTGLLGLRRQSSRKDRMNKQLVATPTTSPLHSSSSRKLLGSWSNEDGAASAKKSSRSLRSLEYGADVGQGVGSCAWPHSEWRTLVGFLTETSSDGASVQGEPRNGLDSRSIARGPRVVYSHQTMYCIESVSESMWLVAIVKNELPTSGWGWQTPAPTAETVEDDVRELVASLASTIRISGRFEASSTRLLRDKYLDKSSEEIGADLAEEIHERGFVVSTIGDEVIFRLIKNQLRVLVQVNDMSPREPGRALLTTRSRLVGRRRRSKGYSQQSSGHLESAAALFLGRDLMSTVID